MIEVFVLDGNDVPNSEDMAMLQALYSRSPASVLTHLKKVRNKGSGSFIQTYVVGYGHESVAELGGTHIFIEGCSMAAAKAIQDDPLYRGQECSSRYLDFSTQPFYDPVGSNDIQEGWRSLYIEAMPKVLEYVTNKYSRDYMLPSGRVPAADREQIYQKTCKAAAFDICRGLLPIGAKTNVAWATDLRTAKNHLNRMLIHPLQEVREIALQVLESLKKKYPNSFGETNSEVLIKASELFDPYYEGHTYRQDGIESTESSQEIQQAAFDRKMLPFWTREMKHAADFEIKGHLDYASYRDVQRHRNGYTSLSTPRHHALLHPWYMDELTAACGPEFRTRILQQMDNAMSLVFNTDMALYDDQYFYPMMVEVPVKLKWNLGQVLYAFNLRSSVSVHPTLRALISEWAGIVENQLGRDIFSLDSRLDYQDTTRGTQDIVAK